VEAIVWELEGSIYGQKAMEVNHFPFEVFLAKALTYISQLVEPGINCFVEYVLISRMMYYLLIDTHHLLSF
jgi:hypothetical protein